MMLTDLSVAEACRLLKKKEISSVELTRAHLENMERHCGLNAYVTETAELALAAAKAADDNIAKGRAREIEGIPLAVKDLFCTRGVRTTACSKMLENFVPPYESTVSRKLLDAGMVMLGKTALDEFAMGSTTKTSYFGPVRNPYSREGEFLVPGGSSGGSAAAVAAGLALAATGTDTGGSIRQPSAFCGLVGMKPTYGRASRYGIVAFASSLDHPGVLTRTVEDNAILTRVISGLDPRDPTTAPREVPDYAKSLGQPVKGMRVGIPVEYKNAGLDPEVQGMWDRVAVDLKSLGAEVVDVSLPHTKYAMPVYYIIAPAEAASNLARYDGVKYGYRAKGPFKSLDEMYEQTRTEGFGAEVRRRMLVGATILTEEFYERSFLKALKVRRILSDEFDDVFGHVDVLLTPTAPTPALSKDAKLSPIEVWLSDVYTVIANLVGTPAISVPAAKTASGLPLGIQIIGRRFDEETVFKFAHHVEKAAAFDNTPSKVMGGAK
ncbi:MAG: Asp-tRNA(Asn)/Glu-tRNA(Gln) amidotransferase subunit GatA [Rickettsiales bacterium]|jgi:aspartyl-tRNA(Asn)/glutamyl-tRNA(Gln) amidotransferase subunit A|nr:Asp-tRNA(Asn)/Glu-tRNA(Gln) amidotransferase subunit GatA [Rickettsiales bacterium]